MIGRRGLMLGASVAGLAAVLGAGALVGGCDGSGATAASPDDMAIGAENAPVTLIEYASAVCPHCREFHEAAWETLKTQYIDTGKVRFIFREFPTEPANVAVAAFQVSRCGGANSEQYFNRLAAVFEQQQAMFASGSLEGIRQKLVDIGASSGLSEQQVMSCINDEGGAERVNRIVEIGRRDGVTGTPTFFLNGQKVEDPAFVTLEGMQRILDAAVAGN